ncbi:MAG: 3-hydroxy-3-methylglutaryl CoA synthase [Alphaproteobacteria bacterium]|jgi:3-hydroxy-3-methylglutaryl CoA synthase|nr:3-hydroxy-3-methylglutaryl CoA synthase [Alphaproteobacteria bacterium]PPR12843.1 MAG: hypothetical protein CFH42_01819 [Alphaproteobacteria bacterium MarineAlpha12_Bin1]|tara:strand:- start:14644 stop:16101 length:1458 start_codon:yes stop_codon:yes gene_type:complete
MLGITGFGAYIPQLRLPRSAIVNANVWANPSIAHLSTGERSMANWDEDSITMAVEAARNCLHNIDRDHVKKVSFASTTFPFVDRLNSGVVSSALNLPNDSHSADLTGSLKAGTSSLISALESTMKDSKDLHLCIAAEKRLARAGSLQELSFGDGAAALTLGNSSNNVILAELIGHHSITDDFVDHYRAQGNKFSYYWEERWIKEEGYLKLIPESINRLLENCSVKANQIDHLIVPLSSRGVPQRIASATDISPEIISDNLWNDCGDTGTAHPLIMLASELEKAKPEKKILVCGFGQGADTILLQTTKAISDFQSRQSLSDSLTNRREENNYLKFLTFNGLLEVERGMRAEQDKQTALSALYRNKDMLLGFIGGHCQKCGTSQIPKTRICVNPNCGAHNSQTDERFSDKKANVMSWTADQLAYSIDPPAHYGMVEFEGGGRLMVDFTDVNTDEMETNMPVRMVFRIKDIDEQRGFVRYFWKASPYK